jgi:endonuclease-8
VPEGDTIAKLASRLHERMAGRVLTATDFRVPSLAAADLSGRRVERVDARGKHILMRVGSDTIHSHLKMDGEWRVVPTGRRPPGRWHEVRVVLTTAEWLAVGSRLGILEIWPTTAEAERLGHLGPDVLGSDWDPAEATRRLTADPARPIGDALIDQRVMAGPGNVYRSEICFLRGVDPRTPAGDVDNPAAMVALTKRVMEANRHRFERATTGSTRDGQRLWVYGRAGESCRRCGTTIVRIVQGDDHEERVAYLCPSCQPPAG